jgi:hypothetical protein
MNIKLCMMSAAAAVVFVPAVSNAVPDPTLPKKRPVTTLVIKYDLAAGASSPVYTLPTNKTVSVTGNCLTSGVRGVASATILQVTSSTGTPTFLEWVGLESPSGAAITDGFSSAAGTHILFLDFAHQVDIQVNSANTIVIHNASGGTRAGEITLSYTK